MRKIFTLLILFTTVFANAQIVPEIEWQKTLGSEEMDTAGGVTVTADGGYIVFGNVMEASGNVSNVHEYGGDYWIAKLDAQGNLEWKKNYGGTSYEGATGGELRIETSKIRQTPDGGYILGANSMSNDGDVTNNFGGYDVWLVKIDSSGTIEWEKNYGSDADNGFGDINVTNDGGYIMTYSNVEWGAGIFNTRIVKLDIQGNVEWTNSYGEGVWKFTQLYSVIQTADGGYAATGWTNEEISEIFPGNEFLPGFYESNRLWVLKINASGVFQWAKAYGGSSIEEGYSIAQTVDGNYVICGMTYSGDGDVVGHPDPDNISSQWVLKLNNAGELLWQKTYGYGGNAVDVKVMSDGNYVIGGSYIGYIKSTNGAVINGRGGTDEYLMKLNQATGDIIWTKTMGGSLQDNLWGFAFTPDGGFITIGDSMSSDIDKTENIGSFDYWVVKLGPDCVVPVLTTETAITICSDTELTLSAASEGNTINWYGSEKGTDILFTGSNFVITALTQGTSYWVAAVSPNGCTSQRTKIVVTVNTRPDLTVENNAVSICENNETVLSASSSAGNSIAWYDSAEGTASIASGEDFTTPVLTETTSYWVESSNPLTNCASIRAEIIVTVLPLPVLTVDTTVTICENTVAVLTAGTSQSNQIVWYDSETAVDWIATGPEFTTPELTQSTSYWVQAYNPQTHCVSDRTEITVIVSPVSHAIVEFNYIDTVCILDNNPVPLTIDGFTYGGTFKAGDGLSINPLTGEINLSSSTAGTYTVTYTFVTSGCITGDSHSTDITITNSLTPVVSFNYEEICTNETSANPILSNGFSNKGTFSSVSGLSIDPVTGEIDVKMSQPGTYTVIYQVEEDLNSCSAFARFEFELVINVCQIQRGISPNGDTLNDWFDLTGIGARHLGIFNRYGREVYAQSNYIKEWGGQDKDGKELPDGTYYYVIEKTNGENLTGWIYINRNH
jgi:gliding motility-associated-like protein